MPPPLQKKEKILSESEVGAYYSLSALNVKSVTVPIVVRVVKSPLNVQGQYRGGGGREAAQQDPGHQVQAAKPSSHHSGLWSL